MTSQAMPESQAQPVQPRQERALIKRRALIDAAVGLFSTEPYDAVTAKSIAAKAGVATGTFYQNFDNKGEILRVIAQERMTRVFENVSSFELQPSDGVQPAGLVKNKFLAVLKFIYEFHLDRPDLHQVLEQRRSIDADLEKILQDGQAVLQERITQFVRSFQLESAQTVAANLYAMAEGLVHALVFGQGHAGVEHDYALDLGAEMLASFFQQSFNAEAQQGADQ